MLNALRARLARTIAPQTRRFDAAAGGRRASGFGNFSRTQAEVSGAASVTRSRARYLAANNPHISNAVNNWAASLVGSGIVPTGDAGQVARFNAWAEQADADGRTDFWGLQESIARALVVDGEIGVQLITGNQGVKLKLIPSEQIDESLTTNLSSGGYIINGIEFNAANERVAYHILPARPADVYAAYLAPVRMPAADFIHVFKPIGVGQCRGISWLAPIVLSANEFDGIVDALALGVKIAAMHAGFLVDQNGTAANPYEGDQKGSLLESGLEPGTLKYLPPGMDVKFSSPQQANEVASFLRFNLQMLAAGLGVPEHYLSGDLTGANYSSLRAGLLPFRARCEQIQYGVLVPQFLRPVWSRVMLVESVSAEIGDTSKVEWLPPRWAQVDPQKDTEATIAEIDAGLTSRKKAVAERGWNIDALDAEIAADQARERQLGLNFNQGTTQPTKESPSDNPKPEPGN